MDTVKLDETAVNAGLRVPIFLSDQYLQEIKLIVIVKAHHLFEFFEVVYGIFL